MNIEVLDIRTGVRRGLLERFYHDIYLPAFPRTDVRERLDDWTWLLWGAKRPANIRLHILVAGDRLAWESDANIFGGVAFEFYKGSSCGLLSFLVVRPDYRGRGISRLLLDRALGMLQADAEEIGRPLRAVFAEALDPARVRSGEDSMSPAERLRILERLGARVVDLPYVQPALSHGQPRSYSLLLLAFPAGEVSRRFLPADVVREFLEEFYTTLDVENPKADPDFRSMMACLRKGQVRLLRPSGRVET